MPDNKLDRFAPFYDLEYGDFTDDLDLYHQFAMWATNSSAEQTRVLELACGSGRIVIALAQLGFKCTGLDASEAMLDLAQQKAKERDLDIEWLVGKMQGPVALDDKGYNLIICALNSFCYLTEQSDQLAALRIAGAALALDGLLVIDLTPPGNSAPYPDQGEVVLQGRWEYQDGEVQKMVSGTWDAAEQIHYVNWIYDQVAGDGTLRRTVIEQQLRYIYPAEASLLLTSAGLYLDAVYGSYDFAPFTADSERMILVARHVE